MAPRLRYPELAPQGIASMRAVEHYLNAETVLPAVLLELVRLRVSLQNGCNFCIGHHTDELRKHNEPDSRIDAVADWIASDAFTPRERAALAWADSVTEIGSRHAADADYAEIAKFFNEKDRVDLTVAIASINAWNRMSIAFRAEWDPGRAKGRAGHIRENAPAPLAAGDRSLRPAAAASLTGPTETSAMEDAVQDDGAKVARN